LTTQQPEDRAMCRHSFAAALFLCAVSPLNAAEPVLCPPADIAGLTLPALLARGLCLDPKVGQAQAEVRRSDSAIGEAAAARAWQLQLQAGPSLNTQQGSGGGVHSAAATGSLAVSRTLADGGLTRARTAQREREAVAAVADLEAAKQDAMRDLAGAWADAREAQATLQAATRALDAARSSEAAARARMAAGTATRVDALSAASTLAQAERDVVSAQTAWRRRQGVLAERLGWPADADIGLRGDESAVIDRLARVIGIGTQPAALDAHPQLAAQRERVQARRAALDASRADEGAVVEVSAKTGPSLARGNNTLPGAWDTTKRWGSEVGLTWSLPLSDGGARRSRTSQSQASLDAALSQQSALERSLREGLWQQWTAWRASDAELLAAQATLSAAQAAESAQRGRYEAGAGTLTDWINAQSDLSARLRQLAGAEQSRLRAAVGTAHAIGRLSLEGAP
jgi:outer membrane protein